MWHSLVLITQQELQEPEFIDMETAFRVNLHRKTLETEDTNDQEKTEEQGHENTARGQTELAHEPNEPDSESNEPDHEPNGPDSEPENHQHEPNQDTDNGHKVTEERVLSVIRGDESISINQMAVALNISRSTVKRAIAKLRQQNRLDRIGSNRSGKWKVL